MFNGSDGMMVDPDATWRSAVAEALARVRIDVQEAETGAEALSLLERGSPRFVILEVDLPDITGYALCKQMRETFGEGLSIVVVSARNTDLSDRIAGLLLGADECLSKPLDAAELAVRVHKLLGRTSQPTNGHAADLTEREVEVLRLLAMGLDQVQIADRLVISPRTVSTHIERVIAKAGVHSRAQAVSWAFRNQIVDLDNP